MGFPIRTPSDQSFLAAPRSLSQPNASFIAFYCQGIHQMLLLYLIYLYPQLKRYKPWSHLFTSHAEQKIRSTREEFLWHIFNQHQLLDLKFLFTAKSHHNFLQSFLKIRVLSEKPIYNFLLQADLYFVSFNQSFVWRDGHYSHACPSCQQPF